MLSSGSIECDRTGVRLSYLPVLRNTLTRPLVTQGKEGVPSVLKQMRDYCISREDIDFITGGCCTVCLFRILLWCIVYFLAFID
jgi:hypothetical protein